MPITISKLICQIHDTPTRIVLAASGGGTGAIAALAEEPGASRTLIEAVVPYSAKAMMHWMGGSPDQFCSASTSRRMAMAALFRADHLAEGGTTTAGVAATAGLATDRPKLGQHRAHVAIQTLEMTASWSLFLEKGRRSRAEEEAIVARLILNAVAEACGVSQRLEIALAESERLESSRTESPLLWRNLLKGEIEAVCHPLGGESSAGDIPDVASAAVPARECALPQAIFPGAFNPLHLGHKEMAETARKILGCNVDAEITIQHPDKPPLDYETIRRRVEQFAGLASVWLTRAATFEEKSRLFPGAVFIVGADTIRRIADPHYYGGAAECRAAIGRIASRGCRFLVFGRDSGTGFVNLRHFDLPAALRNICQEVPPESFRRDISSTAIRRAREWKE